MKDSLVAMRIPTADARLTCYDKFTGYSSDGHTDARSVTVVMTDPEAPEGKQWRFDSEESALDGRNDVWLSVVSENTQPNQIDQPEKATLWVRCMENSTNTFITFNDYTTDNQTVQYRLDEDSMETVWMETIKGGDGIGIWGGSRAIAFIKDMFGKQKLVWLQLLQQQQS